VNETHEVLLKGALSLLGAALVLLQARSRSEAWRRRLGHALTGLAVIAAAAWANFGLFHGGGRLPHHWEQFHYFLGSKYFAELGYDGLYVASMGAEMSTFPNRPYQPHLRDLRTNEVVDTRTLEGHGEEVFRRFDERRWAAFRQDNAFFATLDPAYLARIRTDHGYNPTPAWTFVAQALGSHGRAGAATSWYLAALDLVLVTVAFVVFFRTFGSRLGVLALLVYATGYGWRFYWTGGAFLRQDWFAAVVVGVCMLERQRFRVAGALLAYAAMVRVFPLLFFAGPLAQAVRDRLRGHDLRWFRRLATGAALAALLLVGAGSLTGRGFAAWTELAANLRKHSRTWLTNNVGLRNPLLYDADTYARRMVDWSLPEPWLQWQTHMDQRLAERRWLVLGAAGALGVLALGGALRGRPPEGVAVGPALVFAATALTCYYWGMLVLTLVRRHTATATAVALLVINAGLCAVHFTSPAFELRYGVMSWALLVFFVGWLAAGGGWRTLLAAVGGDRGPSAVVPGSPRRRRREGGRPDSSRSRAG
jgi:hypothetical protein